MLPTARVWVEGMNQYLGLLPYHHGPLVVLILVKDETRVNKDEVEMITEVLARTAPPLSSLLNEEVPSNNVWHIPGYRYHIEDQGMVKATPQGKVGTLTTSALREVASSVERMHSQLSEDRLVMATRGYAEGSTWVVAMKEGDKRGIAAMERVPLTLAGPLLPSALAHAHKVFSGI